MISDEDLAQAVALFYDGDTTPIVTAKGEGKTAQDIIELAREHEVTICENKPLLELLMTLELGEEIPETLYRVIAQIIAFAYLLQDKQPSSNT